jgi:hypothetical protein
MQIFRKDDGTYVELNLSLEELAERVDVLKRITLDDGTTAVRDIGEEFRREYRAHDRSQRKAIARWPLASEALAVPANEIKQYEEHDRLHGVSTSYDRQGRPVFTSQKHRREYCRLHGYYDRNAGYGDAAPLNR